MSDTFHQYLGQLSDQCAQSAVLRVTHDQARLLAMAPLPGLGTLVIGPDPVLGEWATLSYRHGQQAYLWDPETLVELSRPPPWAPTRPEGCSHLILLRESDPWSEVDLRGRWIVVLLTEQGCLDRDGDPLTLPPGTLLLDQGGQVSIGDWVRHPEWVAPPVAPISSTVPHYQLPVRQWWDQPWASLATAARGHPDGVWQDYVQLSVSRDHLQPLLRQLDWTRGGDHGPRLAEALRHPCPGCGQPVDRWAWRDCCGWATCLRCAVNSDCPQCPNWEATLIHPETDHAPSPAWQGSPLRALVHLTRTILRAQPSARILVVSDDPLLRHQLQTLWGPTPQVRCEEALDPDWPVTHLLWAGPLPVEESLPGGEEYLRAVYYLSPVDQPSAHHPVLQTEDQIRDSIGVGGEWPPPIPHDRPDWVTEMQAQHPLEERADMGWWWLECQRRQIPVQLVPVVADWEEEGRRRAQVTVLVLLEEGVYLDPLGDLVRQRGGDHYQVLRTPWRIPTLRYLFADLYQETGVGDQLRQLAEEGLLEEDQGLWIWEALWAPRELQEVTAEHLTQCCSIASELIETTLPCPWSIDLADWEDLDL